MSRLFYTMITHTGWCNISSEITLKNTIETDRTTMNSIYKRKPSSPDLQDPIYPPGLTKPIDSKGNKEVKLLRNRLFATGRWFQLTLQRVNSFPFCLCEFPRAPPPLQATSGGTHSSPAAQCPCWRAAMLTLNRAGTEDALCRAWRRLHEEQEPGQSGIHTQPQHLGQERF